jgi:hypothetical protein
MKSVALGAARDAFGAQTARADARGTMNAAVVDANGLEIGKPAAFGFIHSMAHVVASFGSFTAYFTALGHSRQIVPWGHINGKRKC